MGSISSICTPIAFAVSRQVAVALADSSMTERVQDSGVDSDGDPGVAGLSPLKGGEKREGLFRHDRLAQPPTATGIRDVLSNLSAKMARVDHGLTVSDTCWRLLFEAAAPSRRAPFHASRKGIYATLKTMIGAFAWNSCLVLKTARAAACADAVFSISGDTGSRSRFIVAPGTFRPSPLPTSSARTRGKRSIASSPTPDTSQANRPGRSSLRSRSIACRLDFDRPGALQVKLEASRRLTRRTQLTFVNWRLHYVSGHAARGRGNGL